MQELLDYAASSQDEVCALILNGERVFRCRNVHPEPWHHFRISDDDWLAAEEEGEIIAVFHSHPQSQPALSGADRQMQVMTGLPWWLASGGHLRKYRPVPHLLGRKFELYNMTGDKIKNAEENRANAVLLKYRSQIRPAKPPCSIKQISVKMPKY